MAGVFEKLDPTTAGPFNPGGRITFNIDSSIGFAELQTATLEFSIVPTYTALAVGGGNCVPGLYMEGGAASLVRHIEVRTGDGHVVESIRDANVLNALLSEYIFAEHDESEAALLTKRERRFKGAGLDVDCGPAFLDPGFDATASVVRTQHVSLPLRMVSGLFRSQQQWPCMATRGITVAIVLEENATKVFSEYLAYTPVTMAAEVLVGGAITSFTSAARVESSMSAIRAVGDAPIRDGDTTIAWPDNGTDNTGGPANAYWMPGAMVAIQDLPAATTYEFTPRNWSANVNAGSTVHNVPLFANSAAGANVSVFDTAAALDHTKSGFFIGQHIQAKYVISNAVGVRVSTAHRITNVENNAGVTRITIAPAIATGDAARTVNAFTPYGNSGYTANTLSYSVSQPQIRIKRLMPSPQQLEKFRSASRGGMELPYTTWQSYREEFPAQSNIVSHVPTPTALHHSKAIVSIPIITATQNYRDGLAGVRGRSNGTVAVNDFRFTLDGESSPEQPVPCGARSFPPITFRELEKALSAAGYPVKRIPHGLYRFAFGHSFSSVGGMESLVGRRLDLEVNKSGAGEAMALIHFVACERVLSIGPQGVQVI